MRGADNCILHHIMREVVQNGGVKMYKSQWCTVPPQCTIGGAFNALNTLNFLHHLFQRYLIDYMKLNVTQHPLRLVWCYSQLVTEIKLQRGNKTL